MIHTFVVVTCHVRRSLSFAVDHPHVTIAHHCEHIALVYGTATTEDVVQFCFLLFQCMPQPLGTLYVRVIMYIVMCGMLGCVLPLWETT